MLIDEIKKANMVALKEKNQSKRAAYSVLINKYMLLNIKNREGGKETTDAEVISLIQKTLKELNEEKDMYIRGNNQERAGSIQIQIDSLAVFMPQMMNEDEIRSIIASLPDKSLKTVMQYFKERHQGRVDMAVVSRIVRTL